MKVESLPISSIHSNDQLRGSDREDKEGAREGGNMSAWHPWSWEKIPFPISFIHCNDEERIQAREGRRHTPTRYRPGLHHRNLDKAPFSKVESLPISCIHHNDQGPGRIGRRRGGGLREIFLPMFPYHPWSWEKVRLSKDELLPIPCNDSSVEGRGGGERHTSTSGDIPPPPFKEAYSRMYGSLFICF